MRELADILATPGVGRFLASPLGTLYTISDASGFPRFMVRRFDSDLSPTLAEPFAELVQAAQQWVESRPELAGLVRVEQPSEVGYDFVARPYHLYSTSLDAYTANWEEPLEPPEQLEQMRSAFRAAAGKSVDSRDAIIEAVLERSLLTPTGKTYFDEDKEQFIVVEPKITLNDLQKWVAL